MKDPNELIHIAARWFAAAAEQHYSAYPEVLAKLAEASVTPTVTIRLSPEAPEIICGFQDRDRVIVFHRVPLGEKRGIAN